MFWALAAANAHQAQGKINQQRQERHRCPRTPTSPDAMATAPVVIAGTYVDAIQPVVVSGMPLAGATPEQQQMPVVVVAGTYIRAQSRELARGIGSVQRGIARQLNGASSTRRLSGGTSSTPAPTERTEAASDASSSQLPPGSTLIDTTASQLPPPSGHQRAFAAEQADAAKVQCAKCKGARYVDGAMDVHAPIESRARRACSLTFWASWRRCVASSTKRRRTSWPTAGSHVDPLKTALLAA